jgi:hypothetical protein
MIIYVKNPDRKEEAVGCCGVYFDKDTAVFGDKFLPFTDPTTFPGKIPMLKICSFDDLTPEQRNSFEKFRDDYKEPPPKHLGLITTQNFKTYDDGARVIISTNNVSHDAPKPEPLKDDPVAIEEQKNEIENEKDVSEEKKKLANQQMFVEEDTGVKLNDYSPNDLVRLLPGITSRNVNSLLKHVDTMEDLTETSNIVLRKVGVRPNYFDRLRSVARAFLDELGSEDFEEDEEGGL